MVQTDWLTLSAEHSRRAQPDPWLERAVEVLSTWAIGRPAFLCEQFREAGLVTAPDDFHKWGRVFQLAARRGLIRRVGFARAESSHGQFKPTWVRVS